MVSDRDKAVRAAALALLQTLYQLAGPSQTWGLLGKLTGQQHSLIEERFKHRDKGTTAPSAQPKSPSATEPTAGCDPLSPIITARQIRMDLVLQEQPISKYILLLQAATLPGICGGAGSRQDVHNTASA